MFIFPSYRKKKYPFLKNNEVWWTVLVTDIFMIPTTLILARLGKVFRFITPNGVSFSSLAIFFVAVILIFVYPEKNIWYTVLFLLSQILDGVDGKLSRLKGSTSSFGSVVDYFFDMIAHGPGLILVGLAISLKVNSIYPFLIVAPYATYIGIVHVNSITKIVMGEIATVKEVCSPKTRWHVFCDKRGLGYNPFTAVEVIYFGILLVGINAPHPTLVLLVVIYTPIICGILKKTRRVLAGNQNKETKI